MPEYQPRFNNYSPGTQRVANRLPYHSKIRRERSSVGQSLINSVIGPGSADLRKKIAELGNQHYLNVASYDTPDIIWSADLDSDVEYPTPITYKNFVRNSSFEICTNALRLIDWWELYNSVVDSTNKVTMDSNAAIGGNALKFDISGRATQSISQTICDTTAPDEYVLDIDPMLVNTVMPFRSGLTMTMSMYYNIIEFTAIPVNVTISMDIVGTRRVGGGTDTYTHTITPAVTSGWMRGEFSASFTADYSTLVIIIYVNNTGSGDVEMLVDGVQLELGQAATEWVPNTMDKPFHLDPLSIDGFAPASSEFNSQRAQYVADIEEFWVAVPTRVEYEDCRAVSGIVAGTSGYSYEVDFWKKQWTTEWKLGSHNGVDYIYKTGTHDEAEDEYGRYLIGLTTHNGIIGVGDNGTYDHSLNLHAITYFQDRLWVVASAPDYQSNSIITNYLIVVNPSSPWPESTYLEAYTALEFDDVLAGTLLKVEFKVEDQQHIYISTSTMEYKFRLYFDYFMLDPTNARAHFRESYASGICVKPTLTIKKKIMNKMERR